MMLAKTLKGLQPFKTLRARKQLLIVLFVLLVFLSIFYAYQAKRLRELYAQEVLIGNQLLQERNRLATAENQGEAGGNSVYTSIVNKFSIKLPGEYAFVRSYDSSFEDGSATELRIVKKTDDTSLLDSTRGFAEVLFTAREDQFASNTTVEWIRAQYANQIDVSKLQDTVLGSEQAKYIVEPNNLAGHTITYYLLKDGIGYRLRVFSYGDFSAIQEVSTLMSKSISF